MGQIQPVAVKLGDAGGRHNHTWRVSQFDDVESKSKGMAEVLQEEWASHQSAVISAQVNASQATDRAESIVRRAGEGEDVYFVDRPRAGHGCVVSAEGKSEERRHCKQGK